MTKIIITVEDDKYYVELTDEQMTLLTWLEEKNVFWDEVEIKNYKNPPIFEKI